MAEQTENTGTKDDPRMSDEAKESYRDGYKEGYSDGYRDALIAVQKQMKDQIQEGPMPRIPWP